MKIAVSMRLVPYAPCSTPPASKRCFVASVVLTCALARLTLAQCGSWRNDLGVPPGVDSSVLASVVWDADGDGPQEPRLYIGGTFDFQGRVRRLNGIAYWNGHEWRELGVGAGAGVGGSVHALTTWDPDGPGPLGVQLIVGGDFSIASSAGTANLARWDGASWHSIGQGVSGGSNAAVLALTTWDPDGPGPAMRELVVAGSFGQAGSTSAQNIARRGTSWSPFGTGTSARVRAATAWDPDGPGPLSEQLVVSGSFATAGGVTVNGVARWEGATWRSLGGGVNAPTNFDVRALASWDPDGTGPSAPKLVAGGNFSRIGGVNCGGIANWDGQMWRPFGDQLLYTPNCVAIFADDHSGAQEHQLVAGGNDLGVGEPGRPSGVARWDGTAWTPVGNGIDGEVHTMCVLPADSGELDDERLVVGGSFLTTPDTSGDREVELRNVARLSTSRWRPFGNGLAFPTGVYPRVAKAITWDPDGCGPRHSEVVVAGDFDCADGERVRQFATWRQGSWQRIAPLLGGTVSMLSTWDTDGIGPTPESVISAGYLFVTGGPFFVARLEANEWLRFGGTFNDVVLCATTWSGPAGTYETPELVVGGDFTFAGETPLGSVARWDGTAWQQLGPGLIGTCNALLRWDALEAGVLVSRIVAGGRFTQAGSNAVNSVAVWDGLGWTGLSGNFNAPVYSMVLWDPDGDGEQPVRLVVAGDFTAIDSVSISGVAWWDGQSWQPLGAGIVPPVYEIVVWDPDGVGPQHSQLAAVGSLRASVVSRGGAALWDGVEWRIPDLGVTVESDIPYRPVECAVSWDPDGAGPEPDWLVVGGGIVGAGRTPAACVASWVACAPAECVGDLTGDRLVDIVDLAIFLSNFGIPSGATAANGDTDGDQDVDLADLCNLLRVYGTNCP